MSQLCNCYDVLVLKFLEYQILLPNELSLAAVSFKINIGANTSEFSVLNSGFGDLLDMCTTIKRKKCPVVSRVATAFIRA